MLATTTQRMSGYTGREEDRALGSLAAAIDRTPAVDGDMCYELAIDGKPRDHRMSGRPALWTAEMALIDGSRVNVVNLLTGEVLEFHTLTDLVTATCRGFFNHEPAKHHP